jgi:hypothetical protein
MNEKKCKGPCGKVRPLEDYYKSSKCSDGYKGTCKECHNEACRAWCRRNPEKSASYKRKYSAANPEKVAASTRKHWEENREKISARNRKWRQENPEKHKAYIAVNNATRRGKLVPQPCEHCGAENYKTEGHHPDYSKPLDVVWLCRPCHKQLHVELKKACTC